MSNLKKIYVGFALNAVDPSRYGGWNGALKAAENDIRDLSGIAKANGYDVSRVFLGQNATAVNLRKTLKDLRKLAKQGDPLSIFFNFSGHGGQILNHETICLFEGQILDTDLRGELYGMGNQAKVIALFDCCHAGGLDRSLFAVAESLYIRKAIDPDMAILAANNVLPIPKSVVKNKATIKYLMACKRSKSAYDGLRNGFFTAAVKAVLATGNTTFGQLMAKALAYTNTLQHPCIVTMPDGEKWLDSEMIF